MNQDSPTTWHQSLPGDSIFVSGGDDLSNLLNLDLDFPRFEEPPATYEGFDNPMGDLGMDQLAMGSSLQGFVGSELHAGASYSQIAPHGLPAEHSKSFSGTDSTPVTISSYPQQRFQQQHYQQQRQERGDQSARPASRTIAPPTPQSSEIRGAANFYRYFKDDGITQTDAYHSHRDDIMTFTPLVSPAVTPVDPNILYPDSSLPVEYFSPLTSPAIEAQVEQARRRVQADLSATGPGPFSSPTQTPAHKSAPTASSQARSGKNNRRPSASARSSRRSLRQSPLSKARGRRKQASLPIPVPSMTESFGYNNVAQSPVEDSSPNFPGAFISSEGSTQNSASPEPLSEALMPPPSLPRTVGRSHILMGGSQIPASANEPATPATLMKLCSQDSILLADASAGDTVPGVGDGSKDENAPSKSTASYGRKPSSRPASRAAVADESMHPVSVKTPKLSAKSTPGTSSNKTQPQSSMDGQHKLAESGSRQGSKSRLGGAAPTQVSPAIRPKISPGIKPMMPLSNPGTPSLPSDTSALYLTSKSNYQNILEGTHLPGVSYPETLAENLSSKRTSHKLAEQGRRNRINVALREMEFLLPVTPIMKSKKDGSGSGEGDSGDKSAASSNSKASTVELAIAYIKELRAELSDTKVKLEDREKKLVENNGSVGPSPQ